MRRSIVLATAVVGLVGLSACGAGQQDTAGQSAPAAGSTAQPSGTVARPADPTPKGTPSPVPSGTRATRPSRLPGARTAYVFPVGGCRADASQSHHDYPASDIFAKVGCQFVSPVDGRVDEVTRADLWNPKTNVGRDRGGLSVSVVGTDGVRYYGSHLSSIGAGIKPGVQVRAGQVLGLTGKTGSARFTPSHLHFGISWPTPPNYWWVRRGSVAPQVFLNAWHQGKQSSPVAAVAKAKRSYGADRGCRAYC